jgi:hypothetical protein
VAAVAILVIEPASGSLLRIESEFSIALTPLHIAATTQNQDRGRHGQNKPGWFHWFLEVRHEAISNWQLATRALADCQLLIASFNSEVQ